jgi:cation/acetate symporter
VSIPVSFICGIIGTLLSREDVDPERQAEMQVRALTGIGSRAG